MRVRRRKYEASIYYMRELPEPPPPDELPYYLERLHDIYIKMANVHDVFGYTKEFIRNQEPMMTVSGEAFSTSIGYPTKSLNGSL